MTITIAKANTDGSLTVPPLARALLSKVSQTIHTDRICVGGGFLRGLYMQQRLGLSPEMNDLDIFANISIEDFAHVREALEKELGVPIRYHVGQFENEQNQVGLIEFALPRDLSKACGGIKSVQLNFGLDHPWADAGQYAAQANVGINQISMDRQGQIFMSDAFVSDMQNKTMTMNPDRDWSLHDWERTEKSMDRMRKERPEFGGWQKISALKPFKPMTGKFWDNYRSLDTGIG